MRRILESNTHRVEILRLHERDTADVPMEFGDRLLTLDFLRAFIRDPMNMITLRNILAEVFPVMDIFVTLNTIIYFILKLLNY